MPRIGERPTAIESIEKYGPGVGSPTLMLTDGLQSGDLEGGLAQTTDGRGSPLEEALAIAFGVIVDSDTNVSSQGLIAIACCLTIREPIGKCTAPAVIDFEDSDVFYRSHSSLRYRVLLEIEQALCQYHHVIDFTHSPVATVS